MAVLGTQFKTIVEYAPSQRVPKHWSKKDGREGTILKGTKIDVLIESDLTTISASPHSWLS